MAMNTEQSFLQRVLDATWIKCDPPPVDHEDCVEVTPPWTAQDRLLVVVDFQGDLFVVARNRNETTVTECWSFKLGGR